MYCFLRLVYGEYVSQSERETQFQGRALKRLSTEEGKDYASFTFLGGTSKQSLSKTEKTKIIRHSNVCISRSNSLS